MRAIKSTADCRISNTPLPQECFRHERAERVNLHVRCRLCVIRVVFPAERGRGADLVVQVVVLEDVIRRMRAMGSVAACLPPCASPPHNPHPRPPFALPFARNQHIHRWHRGRHCVGAAEAGGGARAWRLLADDERLVAVLARRLAPLGERLRVPPLP